MDNLQAWLTYNAQIDAIFSWFGLAVLLAAGAGAFALRLSTRLFWTGAKWAVILACGGLGLILGAQWLR